MMIAKNRLSQAHYRPPGGRTLTAAAVAEQPVAMALAAFGMGLGVGVGVGLLLSEVEFFQQAERHSMMEQIVASVSRLLPDAIAQLSR